MSNLLLITDVARLRKIFGRLTEDKNVRLRVVSNLEKGGDELAIEKPDVVFVQTHLSGLSADILIMHLKKQLGRKRSRFVLLASPAQVNETILKPYQGWLDTSGEDGPLLSELQTLLLKLLSKPSKTKESAPAEAIIELKAEPASRTEPFSLPVAVSETANHQSDYTDWQLPAPTPPTETSLEEQGVTYAPRQRLSVYSEFNCSFDNAVTSTPEPETIEQATPSLVHDWAGEIETVETEPARSKKGTFLLWLAPVVIAVVVITYLQQKRPPSPPAQTTAKTVPASAQPLIPGTTEAGLAKATAVTQAALPAESRDQERLSDKAVLSAIAENRISKSSVPVTVSGAGPTSLPDFIPRYGYDKHFSAANPGWERYKGQVTEFKLLREARAIKAIQVIDRGGNGVPESFMKAVLSQVAKKPAINIELVEKKEGYEIQRGRIAENIKVVYYRDERGAKLRAFVLTWQ